MTKEEYTKIPQQIREFAMDIAVKLDEMVKAGIQEPDGLPKIVDLSTDEFIMRYTYPLGMSGDVDVKQHLYAKLEVNRSIYSSDTDTKTQKP